MTREKSERLFDSAKASKHETMKERGPSCRTRHGPPPVAKQMDLETDPGAEKPAAVYIQGKPEAKGGRER